MSINQWIRIPVHAWDPSSIPGTDVTHRAIIHPLGFLFVNWTKCAFQLYPTVHSSGSQADVILVRSWTRRHPTVRRPASTKVNLVQYERPIGYSHTGDEKKAYLQARPWRHHRSLFHWTESDGTPPNRHIYGVSMRITVCACAAERRCTSRFWR